MKLLAAFLTGLVVMHIVTRLPHYIAPLFQDEPQTPVDHQPRGRYWNGGVEIFP